MKKIKLRLHKFRMFFARHYFNLTHLKELSMYGEKDSVSSKGLHSRYGKDFS